jgi:hypothetical protein
MSTDWSSQQVGDLLYGVPAEVAHPVRVVRRWLDAGSTNRPMGRPLDRPLARPLNRLWAGQRIATVRAAEVVPSQFFVPNVTTR